MWSRLLSLGGLPMYVASRGLYNLKPPTVFVPPCIKKTWRSCWAFSGETYELRNDIVVRPFRTHHVIPSQVAFTGDTTAEYMLDPRHADAVRAKVLITEARFLDDGYSIDHARQHGHTHLPGIIEHAQWIRNKVVRYNMKFNHLVHNQYNHYEK
ncbi:tRNase Z TRZ2, chloroplastic-like [Hibiscus syriacus]|uniref:tRNase Z TRZ2, chloroplastic-like n=1 Tax=Hibiscus syriacus TaxID=106335 RepID=UPI00192430F6|nr:tRNase Z TRZ2, chloroplastic-like [Hibiscus syriacus]